VKRDARAAGAAALDAVAEADVDVGAAVARGVLQGHQKSAGGRRVVAVVAAAPGVDVDDAVRGDDEVPGMADAVGEHGCAETRGKRDPAVVSGAGCRRRRLGGWLILRRR
jgi:hypothetical protein